MGATRTPSFQVDLRHVFDESPQAVLVVGDGGQIQYANRTASQRYGYSCAELLGMVVDQLASPALGPAGRTWLATGDQAGEVFEWTHRTKSGVDRPVEVHTQPIRFQGRDVHLATIRDISARRSIVEHDRLQSAIVDTMAHGIVLTSATTANLVFVNPVFANWLGYGQHELQGQHVSVINAPTDKTPEEVAADINHALLRDGYWNGEVKNRRRDGSAIWCYYVVTTFEHWQYGPVWVGVCTDVTLTRELRIERDQALVDLGRTVHEKEALIREVHHRVKNNLQVVASLLRMEFSRSVASETRAALQGMRGRVTAMAILHESLYRSKSLATVDLGEYLRELASQTYQANALDQEAVTLQIDMASVVIGQDQAIPIGLILNEWMSNALKHAFPQGRPGTLRATLHFDSECLQYCLGVADTGVGLPADLEGRRQKSLGMQLVDALCGQIEGRLEQSTNAGVGTMSRIWFEAAAVDRPET